MLNPGLKMIKKKEKAICFFPLLLFFLLILWPVNLSAQNISEPDHQKKFAQLLASFSAFEDRSGGRTGAKQAAEFIKTKLKNLGFSAVGSQTFSLPVRQKGTCRIRAPLGPASWPRKAARAGSLLICQWTPNEGKPA